jgi:hypothetical protein
MSARANPTTAQPVTSIAQAARLRHIEALARRAQQHEGPARRLMDARLQQLRDALAAESGPGLSSPHDAATANHEGLAQLLAHINGAAAPTAAAAPNPALGGGLGPALDAATKTRLASHTATTHATTPAPRPPAAAPELKAISQYRSTWSRLSAEQRLHQALAQVPSNAGPLNTQRLLHQALAAMRDASPHYLQRFMMQVETLLWLEQMGPGTAPVADKKTASAHKTRG